MEFEASLSWLTMTPGTAARLSARLLNLGKRCLARRCGGLEACNLTAPVAQAIFHNKISGW